MRRVGLAGEVDVEGFRRAARLALRRGERPGDVRFGPRAAVEADLFDEPSGAGCAGEEAREGAAGARAPRANRRFLDLLDLVSRHADPARYDQLYAALWRLQAEPALLEKASDPLVRALEAMERQVRRDLHKMTAFLRFNETATPQGAAFVAWFEPSHFIEELAAPFFVDRYAAMRFAILTPRRSILWDGVLTFGPGARRADAPARDAFGAAWDVYYRSIFNPARLALDAMTGGMPKKYWRDMPETRTIPELIRQARAAR